MYWSSIRLGRSPASGSANPPASSAGPRSRRSSSRASGLPRVSSTIRRGHALVEPARDDRGQQRPRVLVPQPPDFKLRQPGQFGIAGWRTANTSATDSASRRRPTNAKDLRGGPVEPLRVVHHAEQRPFLRRLRHQAERGESDQEPVRVVARGQPERDAQRAPLRCGQRTEPAEHRRAQLVQAGEGQLHLRFDPDRTGHREPRGRADQVAQQLRLADPGFAPQHQDGALATVHVCDEPSQGLLLAGPAEQRGRGPLDRHRPCHPVFSTAAEHSQLTLTAAAGLPQWGKPVFPAGQQSYCSVP